MAVNKDIEFHYTGGVSNTDPEQSWFGARSTAGGNTVYDYESTVTAVSSLGFGDSAHTGEGAGVHNGKYVLFVDGNDELLVCRVVGYSDAGWFDLFPVPQNIQVGDTYRLFDVNSLFDDLSAAECAAGDVEYRLIAAYNNSGQTLNGPARVWVEEVDVGQTEFDIAADDNPTGNPVGPTPSDEKEEPDLSGFGASAEFSRPISDTSGLRQPSFTGSLDNLTLGLAGHRLISIRRTTAAKSKRRGRILAMIMVQQESPSPVQTVKTGCLIVLNADGYTPAITVTKDRDVHIGGGARITAEVRTVETDAAVEEADVAFELTGLKLLIPDGSQTDSNGRLKATYHGSEDPDDAGDPPPQATITAKV
jgi:hypothetical protein